MLGLSLPVWDTATWAQATALGLQVLGLGAQILATREIFRRSRR